MLSLRSLAATVTAILGAELGLRWADYGQFRGIVANHAMDPNAFDLSITLSGTPDGSEVIHPQARTIEIPRYFKSSRCSFAPACTNSAKILPLTVPNITY